MKHSWLLWLVPALCLAVPPCSASPRPYAQQSDASKNDASKNDWQAIQRLPPGWSVSISALDRPRTRDCELLRVTGAELICGLERHAFQTRRTFLRSEILEIRLEFPDRHRMILGGIIGGAVGGAIGGGIALHSSDPEALRADPGLGVLFGVSFGSAIGRAIHQHGPILYKRK